MNVLLTVREVHVEPTALAIIRSERESQQPTGVATSGVRAHVVRKVEERAAQPSTISQYPDAAGLLHDEYSPPITGRSNHLERLIESTPDGDQA